MSCQVNPNTYAIVIRCPLEDGAILKSKADAAGMTLSKYLAQILKEFVDKRELTETEKAWVAEHYAVNKIRREKADEKTASGFYKRRHRGRPRKPGPKRKKRPYRAKKKKETK